MVLFRTKKYLPTYFGAVCLCSYSKITYFLRKPILLIPAKAKEERPVQRTQLLLLTGSFNFLS